MKIAVAQTRPIPGDLDQNLERHRAFVHLAIAQAADMIVFPELSLTGYEPKLAQALATTSADPRFEALQTLGDRHHLTIAVGLPTPSNAGPLISLIIFQPRTAPLTYSKQHLHPDELPYFVPGHQSLVLPLGPTHIAPAICYESLQLEHAERAFQAGANLYMASVAKSDQGVARAAKHYPTIARHYSMAVLMANGVGPCDDFVAMGQSAVWNRQGHVLGQLNATTEGLLLYDTDTDTVRAWSISEPSGRPLGEGR